MYMLDKVSVLNVMTQLSSLNGQTLPWINEMKYLGVYFTQGRMFSCSLDHAKLSFDRAANCINEKIGRIICI